MSEKKQKKKLIEKQMNDLIFLFLLFSDVYALHSKSTLNTHKKIRFRPFAFANCHIFSSFFADFDYKCNAFCHIYCVMSMDSLM